MALSIPAIPVARIQAEARQVDVAKALLVAVRGLWTVLLAVPYALGWVLRKTWMGLGWMLHRAWMGLAMLGTAAAVGWRDAGRPGPRGDSEDG
ncbi:MAG: hypothetical protein JWO11_3877 [Nocardioides sp.]|nr:hypothetical protein [Nocardioides sp.]